MRFAGLDELLQQIRLGEDAFLELKAVHFAGTKIRSPAQDALADELAAFANSAGGVVLLGVADDKEVVGIPIDRLDDVERLVRDACEQSIQEPIAPIIERMTLPDAAGVDRPVMRVAVARSLFVHHSPGGYLRRVGSSKRPLPPEELARLFQQRSQSRLIRFDETPVAAATLDDLDPPSWRRFAPPHNTDTREVLLHRLGMAARDDRGEWHPTVAGVLMACPDPRRFMVNAYIQAVAYRGTTVVPDGDRFYQLDARDLTGPLDTQIMAACAFVQRNMRVMAFKHRTGGREDVPQFDLVAVFEAVVNAVAHRDYSMPGSKVRLRMFDDRLEIYTPGMLPNTMTPETLAFRQAARNEAVASLLARCPVQDHALAPHRQHIMDKRGEGVPVILRESERLSGRLPTYQTPTTSELVLTIFAATPEHQPAKA